MRNQQISAYAAGRMGEDRACEYLRAKGMVLLTKRYRSHYGEVDLVMQEGDILVFVEVKTRAKGTIGTGLIAITPAKQKRLSQTASMYLAEKGVNPVVRFDAVEITPMGIVHVQNAFDASGVPW